MFPIVRLTSVLIEGLILGFTFAVGWVAAMLLLGAVMA
jgi:hypothetical protein